MNDPDDLEALVTELNAALTSPVQDVEQTTRLRGWLEQAVRLGASDLLIQIDQTRP